MGQRTLGTTGSPTQDRPLPPIFLPSCPRSLVVGKDVISRLSFSTSKRLVDEMVTGLARWVVAEGLPCPAPCLAPFQPAADHHLEANSNSAALMQP